MNALGKLSDADARADLDAGAEYLNKQPVVFTDSIGCLGCCIGGRFSLPYAAHRKDLKAAVVFTVAPSTRSSRSSPNPLWIWRRKSRSRFSAITERQTRSFPSTMSEDSKKS
jgi:dienelactone hydrolase